MCLGPQASSCTSGCTANADTGGDTGTGKGKGKKGQTQTLALTGAGLLVIGGAAVLFARRRRVLASAPVLEMVQENEAVDVVE